MSEERAGTRVSCSILLLLQPLEHASPAPCSSRPLCLPPPSSAHVTRSTFDSRLTFSDSRNTCQQQLAACSCDRGRNVIPVLCLATCDGLRARLLLLFLLICMPAFVFASSLFPLCNGRKPFSPTTDTCSTRLECITVRLLFLALSLLFSVALEDARRRVSPKKETDCFSRTDW